MRSQHYFEEDRVEAQRLLESFGELTCAAGDAYVELCGHTAALQAVVADLRKCAAFLQASTRGGDTPPFPWLLPARAGPSVAGAPALAPSASQGSNGHVASTAARSEIPFARSPSSPENPRGPPSAPFAPLGTPVASTPTVSRGNLPAGPSAATARPGGSSSHFKGGSHAAGMTPNARLQGGPPASTPAAGKASSRAAVGMHRQPSPLRRAGVVQDATPTRAATSERASGAGPGGSASAADARSPFTPSPQHPHAVPSSGGAAGPYSHLPPTAQRALSAAAAMNGAGPEPEAHASGGQSLSRPPQQHGPGPPGSPPAPAGPPTLPAPLRRAMAQYREVLATREQLLAQHRPARGGGAFSSLADTVDAPARSFCRALDQFYADPKPSAFDAPDALAGVAGSQHRSQVAFSAVVAAWTWLIQTLSGLARARAAGGSNAEVNALADRCVQLLAGAEEAARELEVLLRDSEAAAEAVGRAQNMPSADAITPSVSVGASLLSAEETEAAALWRNRFMRVILAQAASEQTGVGGLPPAQLSQSSSLTRLQAPVALPGSGYVQLPSPLAFWLPPSMWEARAAVPETHHAGDGSGRHQHGALQPASASSSRAPWAVLLPQHPATAHSPAGPGSAVAGRRALPPALLCASLQDALAHSRAQLQLQTTLFQALVETELAAPLLPGPLQIAHPGRGGAAASALAEWRLEQHVARCRLAHLLLVKGAWNRLCSVAELVVEQEEEADGVA